MDNEEYKEILKILKVINYKNKELLEMHEYFIESIENNFLINDQSINKMDTDDIKKKISTIDFDINKRLIPTIKFKIQ